MYNGYIATAKVNASKENHNRIRDVAVASFAKCASGSQYIFLKNSSGYLYKQSCNFGSGDLADHFNYDGFKNPHNIADKCCYSSARYNPSLGRTYLTAISMNILRITTNIGTDSGGSDYLRSTVTKG